MAKIAYEHWNPSPRSLSIVQIANAICAEFHANGYDLTLRQLYYQFVARDYLPNNQRSYDNLGRTIDIDVYDECADEANDTGLTEEAYETLMNTIADSVGMVASGPSKKVA